jgi:hypothetical protein
MEFFIIFCKLSASLVDKTGVLKSMAKQWDSSGSFATLRKIPLAWGLAMLKADYHRPLKIRSKVASPSISAGSGSFIGAQGQDSVKLDF